MRIWLNHWFSTAYRLIENARVDLEKVFPNEKIEFIGTNERDTCVYKKVCEEFYPEPKGLNENEYIEWCLDFCREQEIDVFIPRKNMLFVSKHLNKFKDIFVKVLVLSDYGIMSVFNDKFLTYRYVSCINKPAHACVNNVEDFEKVYAKLKTPFNRVCIKYAKDEGATSFRVIDDRLSDINALRTGVGSKMSYEDVVDMLSSVSEFEDLLVLPYLNGPEVSIDCLQTNQGLIAVPRLKEGRVTKIDFNEKYLKIAEKFAKEHKIDVPYNLQLRWHDNMLFLLEVNTRMSGGAHIANEIGVNFLALAVEQLVNGKIEKKINIRRKNVLITQIETPILL